MVEGNGAPSLGEVARSQARMEKTLDNLVMSLDHRFETLAKEISVERHNVANLRHKDQLFSDFIEKSQTIAKRVEQIEKDKAAQDRVDALEMEVEALKLKEATEDAAHEAVSEFKKALSGGKWLGALLGVGQLVLIAKALGWP